jgi:hypothetical protein
LERREIGRAFAVGALAEFAGEASGDFGRAHRAEAAEIPIEFGRRHVKRSGPSPRPSP